MHPELTSKVSHIIHQCLILESLLSWVIFVDSVFSRLNELLQQKIIRLSELPLAGKIRAVYQSALAGSHRLHVLLVVSMEGCWVVMNVYHPQGQGNL